MRTDIVRPIVLGLSLGFATATFAAETIAITMDKVAFAPTAVSARVGDTIEWRNADIVAHTATARDKSFDVNVLPNKTGKLVLKKAGQFDYYCRYHPTMTGTITVTE
ncbi:MAG: cupredoxin domain-containing protein [Pseudolabrys sp.]